LDRRFGVGRPFLDVADGDSSTTSTVVSGTAVEDLRRSRFTVMAFSSSGQS
jgi:hypothetical protein